MKKIVIELTEDEAKIIADMALANDEEKEALEKNVFDQVFEQLMIGTKRSVIEWHPYPDEKPSVVSMDYLVAAKGKNGTQVTKSVYLEDWFMNIPSTYTVLAWAKFPEFEEG